jgi:hypothetical protein
MDIDAARQLIPEMKGRHTPMSDYLFEVLKEPLISLIPDDVLYQRAFDSFEYLWCLLHVDAKLQLDYENIWPPIGAFCGRGGLRGRPTNLLRDEAKKAADKHDESWPPLKGRLFGDSIERLSDALKEAHPKLDNSSRDMC